MTTLPLLPTRGILAACAVGGAGNCRCHRRTEASARIQRASRVQRLALPPDELRPGGHRRPRVPEDHGEPRRRVDALRHSAAADSGVREHRDFAPTYYLQTDAPLYYYSFTDAYIAIAYRR